MSEIALETELWSVIDGAETAGTGTASSAILDMSNYDTVDFFVVITDSTDTGTVTLQAQQSDTNAAGGMATLTGSAVATSAADDDLNDQLVILSLHRPAKRYIRAQVVRATANSAHESVVARQYNSHNKAPLTQLTAEVAASAILLSPAEA